MTTGGGGIGGEIFVNIRTDGSSGGGGVPGAGGAPRPAGGGTPPKDPQMTLLTEDQKKQLENARQEKKALKEYQDFQKLKGKENQNDLLNELQRGRRQATMVAGAVTTGMLARNSKIMSTTMGSLSTMFGAFIDVFLMPFIPLIIPVLKYIADLLPKWMDWTQKFADLFAKDPMAALKMAAEDFKKLVGDWGVEVGALFGFSEDEVRGFYAQVGEWADNTWNGIQTAWTNSINYVKGVWEESDGNMWEATKIVANDFWTNVVVKASDAAWSKFEEKFPTAAEKIETTWTKAGEYVRGVWDESGCDAMKAIAIVGMDAMGAAGRAATAAGRAAWTAFSEAQPALAAEIESAWCTAIGYVTQSWQAGGGTIVGFFREVGTDIGVKLMEGLDWLWNETGLKSHLIGMLRSIQDWIFAKTGIGGPSSSRIVEGSMQTPEGGLWDLNTINAGNIENYAHNTYQGSATAPNWMQRWLGVGDMGFKNRMKDWLRGAGNIPGTDIDVFEQDKGLAQELYRDQSQR